MSESFETFYERTKEQYTPNLVEYTPEDMETLRERIAAFLRPSYEAALKKQEKQAAQYNGQLDADAWSRGMGSSTYVSDLKYRRQNALLENRAEIESAYGAALAEQLYKAWEKQLGYRMEAEKFNAQARNEADQRARTEAGDLYRAYLASLNRGISTQKQEEAEEKQLREKQIQPLVDKAWRRLTMRKASSGGGSKYITERFIQS